MTIRNFESEAESTRKYRKEILSRTPADAIRYDSRLPKIIYRVILTEMDEQTRNFLCPETKRELCIKCNKIAEFTEGLYQIRIMPYEDLRYAINNSQNILVGFPARNSIFALIDDDARFVGIYIPKSKRQLVIEKKIENAIIDLRKYFESKGAKPSKYIEEKLIDFLWMQKFPYSIPNIKIIATRNDIEGEHTKYRLRHGRVMHVKYADNAVYYSIK